MLDNAANYFQIYLKVILNDFQFCPQYCSLGSIEAVSALFMEFVPKEDWILFFFTQGDSWIWVLLLIAHYDKEGL